MPLKDLDFGLEFNRKFYAKFHSLIAAPQNGLNEVYWPQIVLFTSITQSHWEAFSKIGAQRQQKADLFSKK